MKNSSTGNKIKLFLHILVWVVLIGIPLYFFKRWKIEQDFIWLYFVNILISGIIFYVNYLVLVPTYFFKRPKYRYYLSVLFVLVVLFFVSYKSNEVIMKYLSVPVNPESTVSAKKDEANVKSPARSDVITSRQSYREVHFINFASTSFFLIFISLGMRVLERQSKIERLQEEMQKEKLNSELAFLKNQISPHFFFNTLNNIYSLISINADDSQKAVLKLSKLMRYLLYESDHGDTKMSSEIEFINNYIDLMKLRISDKIRLSVSFPTKYDDVVIPPLLFIPFIENAFKHGISYREKSFIDISMQVEKEAISFVCINSLVKSKENEDIVHPGIGLENVRKRLNLLFPSRYILKIDKSETQFEVLLWIKLS
jgi:two-component system, LytTR family, sensor kinase